MSSTVGKKKRGLLLVFLGQQIAKNTKVHVDKLQIDEIVDFLTNKSGEDMEERERVCELLYDSGKLDRMMPKRILRLMVKTKFYRKEARKLVSKHKKCFEINLYAFSNLLQELLTRLPSKMRNMKTPC